MREMKDSGIEWIGQIPTGWKLRRAKTLFTQRNSKGNGIEVCFLQHKNTGLFRKANLRALSKSKKMQIFKCSKRYIKAILL